MREIRVHARFRSLAIVAALGLTGAIAACGGGGSPGGSGGSPPATSPTPRPSPVVPITTPEPPSSTAEIILGDGDVIAGDLEVANIEEAALGADNVAAILVTLANAGNRAAILTRASDGTYRTLLDPRAASPAIDTLSLSRLRLAPSGELVFQSGDGLDSDRLYRIANGTLEALAGAAPGPVFPAFRILGNVRVGAGGVVAFVGGGDHCVVVVDGDQQRVSCTNALYVAGRDAVTRLDDGALDLTGQRPTAVRVELDPTGGAWFSLPRRDHAPLLLRYAGGETTSILTADDALPQVGQLNSVEAVAINAPGQVLLAGGPQVFSGDRRPQLLGVLSGASFAQLAMEGTELDGANVASLRALALDGAGRALFEASLGDPNSPATQANSLWLGDDGGLVEIAREGAPLAGEASTVVQLLGSRLNAAGDVAFVTQLGSVAGGVAQVQETRATVRRADGRLVTIASTRSSAQFGELGSLQIVGFDEAGTVLMIGTRGRSSDRLLLLGRSDQPAG